MKIRPLGAEYFLHADGRTDMTKLTVDFAVLRTCLIDSGQLMFCREINPFFVYQLKTCTQLADCVLRKATVSFVTCARLPVRPSAWYNSAPTWWLFMKFDILIYYGESIEEFKFI